MSSAGIQGTPPLLSLEKATAPMAANVMWHRDTCPEVLASRPSESSRIT